MTPAELHKALFSCLGKVPGMAAREACLPLLKGGRQASLRYEWIKDWPAFTRLVETPGIELGDSEEWVSLTV